LLEWVGLVDFKVVDGFINAYQDSVSKDSDVLWIESIAWLEVLATKIYDKLVVLLFRACNISIWSPTDMLDFGRCIIGP